MTPLPRADTTADRIRPRDRDAIVQSLRAGRGAARRAAAHPGRPGTPRSRPCSATSTASPTAAPAAGSSSASTGRARRSSSTWSAPSRWRSKLVTVHADLTPDRRLHATGGQARSLYAELMRNMATRAKPDGGAMASVVERFVTTALDRGPRAPAPTPEAVIRDPARRALPSWPAATTSPR